MQPRIFAGDAVTLEPTREVQAGDIVLARVRRRREILVLHQVLEIRQDKCLIGNASGRIDGWVEAKDILGRATPISHPST